MRLNSTDSNFGQVSENWQKIYQTFRGADFQSYDFESLRKSMIDYLKLYYPEEFNDFIESSEFVAFIDLLSFMGQSLAFRNDLNVRENFIDTAQRRESVLKLARLVNYNAKRNECASGLLKVVAVRSSENIIDSNGINLSGKTIFWADSTNGDWQEQFYNVLNACFRTGQQIGSPIVSKTINGILNEEYQFSIPSAVLPVFQFTQQIEGMNLPFEVVGATISQSELVKEITPLEGSNFSLISKNDQKGFSSSNTGFFALFKQGSLQIEEMFFSEPVPNTTWSIQRNNVNRTDVWLFELDNDSNVVSVWTQVPSVSGSNIAFNDVSSTSRKIYEVVTKNNDQIEIQFGDGTFAEIPQGRFVVVFRTSAGVSYRITPADLQSVPISVNYVSKSGKVENITLTLSLQYTVANSMPRETVDSIKRKAPQQFYSQNRMITGEDYQLFPFSTYSNILKVKSVNRSSSGVSRYYDTSDNTGKYSRTTIMSDDGLLYYEKYTDSSIYKFSNTNDILNYLRKDLQGYLSSTEYKNFYYFKSTYDLPKAISPTLYFNLSSEQNNLYTGYFFRISGGNPVLQSVGNFSSASLIFRMIKAGSVIKFRAPTGKKFNKDNILVDENDKNEKIKTSYAYVTVTEVVGDGINQGVGNLDNGLGPVRLSDPIFSKTFLSDNIDDLPVAESVYPPLFNFLDVDFENQVLQEIFNKQSFGLGYSYETSTYEMLPSTNESDWVVKFSYRENKDDYEISYKKISYIFESKEKISFFVESDKRVYDSDNARIISDQIKILSSNGTTINEVPLKIIDYFDNSNKKVSVVYDDIDYDGFTNNLEFFDNLVNPLVGNSTPNNFIFFEKQGDKLVLTDKNIKNGSVLGDPVMSSSLYKFPLGQIFYFDDNQTVTFKQIQESGSGERTLESLGSQYIAKIGTKDLHFQYVHVSPLNRRIDPSKNNIIDMYILTTTYAQDFKRWISSNSLSTTMPNPPTSEDLRMMFADLEDYKTISDTVIFNPSKFKILFGSKKNFSTNSRFVISKSRNSKITDVEVRTKVSQLINDYFDLERWDFGDTFYFTDLASYLHMNLPDDLASVRLESLDSNTSSDKLQSITSNYDEIISAFVTVNDIVVE